MKRVLLAACFTATVGCGFGSFAFDASGGSDGAEAGDTGVADALDVPTPDATDIVAQDVADAANMVDVLDATDSSVVSRTIQQLANPSDPMHVPASTRVEVAQMLVAISPRRTSIGTMGNCGYYAWVEDPAGGSFAGMWLYETEPDDAVDGGPSCTGTRAVIPPTLQIGSMVSRISGTFQLFCASPGTCPSDAATEIVFSAANGDAITLTGSTGPTPAPILHLITELDGTGTTPASSDLSAQNSLVTISMSYQQQIPMGGNFDDLVVSPSAGDTTHEITTIVSGYPAAACHRANLATLGLGGNVGTVIGILSYGFGSWNIQPRLAADISGASAGCTD